MPVACFWMDRNDTALIGLRRYRSTTRQEQACPVSSYHQAIVMLAQVRFPEHLRCESYRDPAYDWPGHDDAAWPAKCPCGYRFDDEDPYQHWVEPQYIRRDSGQLTTLRDAPAGAMWDAWWMPRKGADGISLSVRCPGGHDWLVDERARNCGRPDDGTHRCWVRHGEPPVITVDKNGDTCQAGGGSILTGNYHGFLRHGVFEP